VNTKKFKLTLQHADCRVIQVVSFDLRQGPAVQFVLI
jgi:hypothetical protein